MRIRRSMAALAALARVKGETGRKSVEGKEEDDEESAISAC